MAKELEIMSHLVKKVGHDQKKVTLEVRATENGIALAGSNLKLYIGKNPTNHCREGVTNSDGKLEFEFPTSNHKNVEISISIDDTDAYAIDVDLTTPPDPVPASAAPQSTANSQAGDNSGRPKLPQNTLICSHCSGDSSCNNGKKFGRTCSCEYCIKGSEIKVSGLFPIVPCAYCKGKGFHEVQKSQQQKDRQDNNGDNRNRDNRRDNSNNRGGGKK